MFSRAKSRPLVCLKGQGADMGKNDGAEKGGLKLQRAAILNRFSGSVQKAIACVASLIKRRMAKVGALAIELLKRNASFKNSVKGFHQKVASPPFYGCLSHEGGRLAA